MQLALQPADGLQRDRRGPGIGADGEGQRVKDQIVDGEAVLRRNADDFPGHGDSPVRRLRDAVLIQEQAHDHGAVLRRQGEYLAADLLPPVRRIDHRLAVVDPHSGFHRRVVGRVNLQRERVYALELLHGADQHLLLVNSRDADVDIQNLCPGLLLLRPFPEHIAVVLRGKGFLQLFLAGRVDPLADQDRRLVQADRLCPPEGGDDRPVLRGNRLRGDPCHRLAKLSDIRRGCPAAAADRGGAVLRNLTHLPGKFLRRDVIQGPAVLHPGHPRVRCHNDRCGGNRQEPPHNAAHLLRPQAAVYAQCGDAEALQQGSLPFRRKPGQEFLVSPVRAGRRHRQICGFPRRQDSRLELIGVCHRLDQDQIGAVLCGPDDFLIHIDGILKGQIAQRRQHVPGGPEIQRDRGIRPVFQPARFLCAVQGSADNGDQISRTRRGILILEAVGAEGIGIDDVRACLQILPVHLYDRIRMKHVPGLREFARFQPVVLQPRPRGAVPDQNLLSQPIQKSVHISLPFFCNVS